MILIAHKAENISLIDYIAYIYSWTLAEMAKIQFNASETKVYSNEIELFMILETFTSMNRYMNIYILDQV